MSAPAPPRTVVLPPPSPAATTLLVVAGLLFVVSFFLPAYTLHDSAVAKPMTGWACARVVFKSLGEFFKHPGQWYYPAFNVPNFAMTLFVPLFLTTYRTRPLPDWMKGVLLLSLIHVISWAFRYNSGELQGSVLGIGYYLWVASIAATCAYAFGRSSAAADPQ